MKKILLLTLLILILLFAACTSDIAASGGVVVHGTLPTPTASYDPALDIVYVTQSGTKYHTADCSYLSDSCIPMTREQAISEGREPCSRCHPDDPKTND